MKYHTQRECVCALLSNRCEYMQMHSVSNDRYDIITRCCLIVHFVISVIPPLSPKIMSALWLRCRDWEMGKSLWFFYVFLTLLVNRKLRMQLGPVDLPAAWTRRLRHFAKLSPMHQPLKREKETIGDSRLTGDSVHALLRVCNARRRE